jgi:hypothetical protein
MWILSGSGSDGRRSASFNPSTVSGYIYRKSKPNPENSKRNNNIMDFQSIKNRFDEHVNNPEKFNVLLQGPILGVFTRAAGGTENRYLITKALTGNIHSKDMTMAQWYAMWKFVDPGTDASGHWGSNHGTKFEEMCKIILEHICSQPGQMELIPKGPPIKKSAQEFMQE